MKRQLRYVLGTIIFAIVAFALSAANAQTTSNGPYYANPSWDQKLQCDTQATCPRFIVLSNWNSAAVLDRETGLVWERSPLSPCTDPRFCIALDSGRRDWKNAQSHCNEEVTVGNRGGWRLPTLQELRSLVDFDPANTASPKLPPGHPFIGVQSGLYWSATTFATIPSTDTFAWIVIFSTGNASGDAKSNPDFVWCVRSGQPGSDPQ